MDTSSRIYWFNALAWIKGTALKMTLSADWLRKAVWVTAIVAAIPALGHVVEGEVHGPAVYTPPSEPVVVGGQKVAYQLIPGWARENEGTHPIGHAHAMAEDAAGRLYLVNTSETHCVVVLSPEGEVLTAWGDFCVGAHGLQIIEEAGKEVLYIADAKGNHVYKTSLEGEVLLAIPCPMESGLYEKAQQFRPSKTMHLPDGSFYVIDGYGKDYIHRYDKTGKYLTSFGGDLGEGEAKLAHWGPHGGAIDFQDPQGPTILLALSDQQRLKRFTLDGKHLETIPMLGANPRDILFHGDLVYIPHLGDDWPKDPTAPGFVSVHDRRTLEVVDVLGGGVPGLDGLETTGYQHDGHVFLHPHGLVITRSGDLYVAQYQSNGTYPLKFGE